MIGASQFSLFADPEPALPVPPSDLPPLRRINPDWLDVKITDEEFATEREQHSPEATDDYVMLKLLEARGVRTKPCNHHDLPYMYDYVEEPFVIRKRTMPGFAVTCRQPKGN
jgi:hypothetical protein